MLCSPLFGEDFPFDEHIFQMGGSTTNQFRMTPCVFVVEGTHRGGNMWNTVVLFGVTFKRMQSCLARGF